MIIECDELGLTDIMGDSIYSNQLDLFVEGEALIEGLIENIEESINRLHEVMDKYTAVKM